MTAEPRSDRLARIKRALELGMPPLSTEDQRWLFEQVPKMVLCHCGDWLSVIGNEFQCPHCGELNVLDFCTLAPPRKRCEQCGGAGVVESPFRRGLVRGSCELCPFCGGSGFEKEEKCG